MNLDYLEQTFQGRVFTRLASSEQLPGYYFDPDEQLWMESDELFRARIKDASELP